MPSCPRILPGGRWGRKANAAAETVPDGRAGKPAVRGDGVVGRMKLVFPGLECQGMNMTHVNLDGVDEAVRQFVLAVAVDPAGSVLELNGRPVAWVVPAAPAPANGDEPWTEAKNQRRCDLIDRKYAGTLTPAEAVELVQLQEQMLRHRQRVAPLPLEDARRLHQELLNRATSQPPDA